MLIEKHTFLNAISASLIGGPDFHNTKDRTRIALLAMAEELVKLDGEFVLKVALYTRQELNIRTTANLLLAFAANHVGEFFCIVKKLLML